MNGPKAGRATIILLIALCWPRLADAASLTFQWDPPTGGAPAGYVLFAGTAPGVYSTQINMGAATSYTLSGVPEGGTYYFAVAAYDSNGTVGDRSNEVSATVPLSAPPPVTGLVLAPSLPSPQVVGTTVNWLATASGGMPPYQYQWSYYQSGQWNVGPWTNSASMPWTPSTAGTYQIRAGVRSAGSTSLSGEMLQTVPFTVAAPTTSCDHNPPTTSITAGTGLSYSVAVTNNSSATCGATAFALTTALPTGWTASFSPAASLSLSPGATGSVTLALSAPGTASGNYSFTVTSTNPTTGEFGSATGSATVGATVPSPLSVTLSVSVSNGRERTVSLKIRVRNSSQYVPGAAIAIVVRSPLGAVTSLSAISGADGSANLRSPLSTSDAGTWQVQATATSNGATGTATTTFTVR